MNDASWVVLDVFLWFLLTWTVVACVRAARRYDRRAQSYADWKKAEREACQIWGCACPTKKERK